MPGGQWPEEPVGGFVGQLTWCQCPCGSPYGLLPTMAPLGLAMNLLPVMVWMGQVTPSIVTGCQPTLYVSCLRRHSVRFGGWGEGKEDAGESWS